MTSGSTIVAMPTTSGMTCMATPTRVAKRNSVAMTSRSGCEVARYDDRRRRGRPETGRRGGGRGGGGGRARGGGGGGSCHGLPPVLESGAHCRARDRKLRWHDGHQK